MEYSKFSNALNAPGNDLDIEEDIVEGIEENPDADENNGVLVESISKK
ncbi:MAG: hypothetical protein MJ252_23370 [archaeon]|nr:hypothetical protein [archaeon]